MTPISPNYIRIFHEYEIADASNQHFASIVYVREVNANNNYAPLYKYSYEKSALGYCVPTRIILNRERDNFTKAKDLVLNELAKPNNGIKYASEMAKYLKMMFSQ